MNSYLNEENNIKASQVRKLIKETNINYDPILYKRAQTLSLELVDYLKINYPNNFKIQIYTLPNFIGYIDKVYRNKITMDFYIKWIPEIKNLKIHDIGIIRSPLGCNPPD